MNIFQQEAADYIRPTNVQQQRVNMEAPPSQRMTATPAEKEDKIEYEEIQQNNQQRIQIMS